MAYIISEDARELLKDVREFCENEIKEQVKEYDVSGEWPSEIYEMAVEMQLHMMDVPEEYGGLGLDHIDQAAIMEQIAWADAGVAVTLNGNGLALKPVLLAGTEEQKRKCCDIIVNGGWGAFAITEPDAGCDAANGKATAVREGDSYVLNGRKCFITNAPNAKFFVVFAKTDPSRGHRGISAFLVERDRPGVSTSKHEEKMGFRLSTAGDLVLEDVRVPADHLIGTENKGYGLAMKILDYSRIGVAAEAVGLAQRALDLAVEYAKSRETFGKPISQHQMIQYKIAEMEMRIQAARAMTYHAAELADNGVVGFGKISSCAKCFASETAVFVANEAVQIFGGYGYMKDYEIEKIYRDAKLLTIFEGTNEIQHLIISGYVLK